MSKVQPGALTVSRSLSLDVGPCALKFSLATSRKSRLKTTLTSRADSLRMDAALTPPASLVGHQRRIDTLGDVGAMSASPPNSIQTCRTSPATLAAQSIRAGPAYGKPLPVAGLSVNSGSRQWAAGAGTTYCRARRAVARLPFGRKCARPPRRKPDRHVDKLGHRDRRTDTRRRPSC